MLAEFLLDHLVHTVDLYQLTELDGFNERGTEFLARVPCLVDESSGRREMVNNTGETLTYNYAITLSPKVEPGINWILKDARDEQGKEIFAQAVIQDVRVYREPGSGITGYLVYCSNWNV